MAYLTTETAVNIDDVTLIPIVRISLHTNDDKTRYWLSADKQPWAIIVCDTGGVRAFNMCATEITIAPLAQEIPTLNAILAPYW